MPLAETRIVCRWFVDNEVGTLMRMVERLGAAEVFWAHSGNALGTTKGLGLRLTGR